LLAVKVLHTVVWAFFVVTILGIWIAAGANRFRLAMGCIAIVLIEVLILLLNGWHCPLTPIAARYTSDRRPNFDIFLPQWLARYNKEIFGTLFVLGVLFALARWRLAQ
jgi:hypothetical protein